MRARKLILSAILFGVSGLAPAAQAAVNLKKVNIVDGNQIELLFDGKVETSQVKTEFVRDNIQLSLSNASVYPAKVSMVSGSDLTKVFAYQYAPQLVRARFTVKGEAAGYANRLQVKILGKTVTLRIAAVKVDQVATAAASALRTASAPEKVAEAAKPAAAAPVADEEKKGLFDRVMAADKPATASAEKSTEKPEKNSERRLGTAAAGKVAKEGLTSGKSLPSPFRSIGVMLFVLGLFGLFVMFIKRLKSGDKSVRAPKGLGGFLSKISGQGAGKGMIEVLATHHLAPKRSIVVVRVQDRMLVLGMTNDSVNLITEFKTNEDGDAEESIGLGDFAASLKKFENEAPKPATNTGMKANLGDIAAAALGLAKPKPVSAPRANAAATAYQATQSGANANVTGATSAGAPTFSPALAAALAEPSVKPSIRAQIKDRVQGMKQL